MWLNRIRVKLTCAVLITIALLPVAPLAQAQADVGPAGEQPVAPYSASDANAGATPIQGDSLYRGLHGREGIDRIVADLIERNTHDPRIEDIFKAADLVRLRRTLAEQICYLSGGPCHYTGRDMRTAHADMGVQTRDFDALVENLQAAMRKEGVSFHTQNRLLAKLAPMRPKVVRQ